MYSRCLAFEQFIYMYLTLLSLLSSVLAPTVSGSGVFPKLRRSCSLPLRETIRKNEMLRKFAIAGFHVTSSFNKI